MQKLLEFRHWLKALKFQKAVMNAFLPIPENNNLMTGVYQSEGVQAERTFSLVKENILPTLSLLILFTS